MSRFAYLQLLLFLLFPARPARAYSVLTHEAIIDASWLREIKPLLLKRFPGTTDDQLREAHGYCYGGAIIQDMGYYPFGNRFFSDLVHYARSGDFVMTLLHDAQTVNEYAFALGALAHYASDIEGHPVAINRVVPLMYPKLRKKFGNEVTYEDDPGAHLKTEFGFDVVQVARGQYAPDAYHDFIGFQVTKDLLSRAFEETYGINFPSLFLSEDLTLGTFRYSVSELIPKMTKAAWSAKKDDIQKLQAGMTRKKFVYRRMTRARYRKDWNEKYERPGPGARFLGFLFQLVPKIGPFRAFAFKVPTPEAEKIFIAAFEGTLQRYHTLLASEAASQLHLSNENFDVGKITSLGQYRMADEAYSRLLQHFAKDPTKISPDLRENIVAFYGASGTPSSQTAQQVLAALRTQ